MQYGRAEGSTKDMNTWSELKDAFVPDGSWRDIYVKGTTLEDWQLFLDFLHEMPYRTSFSSNRAFVLPSLIEEMVQSRERWSSLIIFLNDKIQVNCRFFVTRDQPDPIELDFKPQDIQSEEDFKILEEFIWALQKKMRKPVYITAENIPDAVIAKYE